MKNAVIYARYSSSSQREESIEGQLKACHAFAESEGYTVVNEYIDRAKSGTNDRRPQFQRMISDSADGKFEAVIVYQFDRFARDMFDSVRYERKLENNGAKLLSAREPIDDSTPSGLMNRGMLQLWAQFYSDDLSQKVRRRQAVNASKCKFNGGTIPWGYKIDENQKFIIDEEAAPVIRRIFTEFAEGRSVPELVADLRDKRYKTAKGTPFGKNSLQRLLRNKRYTGIYMYGDTEIEGGMPEIIPEELFNKAQERIKKSAHRRGVTGDYLLTTKLYCGHCGEMMVGVSGTSKTGTPHFYYSCKGARAKTCHKRNVRQDIIEDAVITLCRSLLTDEAISLIARCVAEISEREAKSPELTQMKKRVSSLDKEIGNLVKAIGLGQQADILLNAIGERREEKERLEAVIAEEEARNRGLTEPEIRFFLTEIRKGNVNKPKYNRALISVFVNKIYLFDDGHADVYLNTSKKPVEITADIRTNVEQQQSSYGDMSAPPVNRPAPIHSGWEPF